MMHVYSLHNIFHQIVTDARYIVGTNFRVSFSFRTTCYSILILFHEIFWKILRLHDASINSHQLGVSNIGRFSNMLLAPYDLHSNNKSMYVPINAVNLKRSHIIVLCIHQIVFYLTNISLQ